MSGSYLSAKISHLKKVCLSAFACCGPSNTSLLSTFCSLFAGEDCNHETCEHMRRVGMLSASLALIIGRPQREIAVLRVAAPLHDVGKVCVPHYILDKQGKLTESEFDQMKSHTFIGGQILGGSRFPVFQMASEIALSHHERWDGKGYPSGLAGDAIPLTARITAIADVFDALIHPRPYKKAWNLSEAIESIEQGSGRHFDPALAPAFLSALRADGLQRLAARVDAESYRGDGYPAVSSTGNRGAIALL